MSVQILLICFSLGKGVQREFQVADSVGFWLGEVPSSHVDLERWQDQLWWVEFGVTLLSME